MRLLPKNREYGWAPYIWLVYLGFFFLQPVLGHFNWKQWVATGIGTAIFLVLYFGFFWSKKPWTWLYLAGMVVLGVVYVPYNVGGAGFFIYAACFVPFVVDSMLVAIELLIAIGALVSLECWFLHLSIWVWIDGCVLAGALGSGNIFFAQRNRANAKLRMAQKEVEHLAKVAERERIARDLHDVLGHTLSVVILKSELAGKLIDSDPAKARAEIKDVEQISRQALAEVRNTIRGYRAYSLEAEFRQAKAALETAGVTVQSEPAEIGLSATQESVVALIVREAVTNVVRHAQARNCCLRLAQNNGNCVLEIQDDGRGGEQPEGHGVQGMRERIEALGGTLMRDTAAGTKLTFQFPLAAAKVDG